MKREYQKACSKLQETSGPAGLAPLSAFESIPPQGASFATTHWSVILEADHEDTARRRAALEKLCQTYWAPVYAFIRRSGHGVEDAQDLTQGFFEQLLKRHALRNLDPRKGKFRSFLLVVLRRFLINEAKRAGATKRGGGRTPLALEAQVAEDRFLVQTVTQFSPEQLFDRNWALAVMDQAFARLRSEFEQQGLTGRFERLKAFLWNEGDGEQYGKAGETLSLSSGAVKMAVHRLRHRYGELLRQEIGCTVETPSDIDAEMRYLLDLLIQ